jgi:hypothetical protein
MAVCPNGHDSVADDFCDGCGTRIASNPIQVVGRHHAGGPRPAGSPDDRCPWCGNPSSSQYCERCGFRVRRPFAPLTGPSPAAGSRPGAEPSLASGPSLEREPAPERERSLEPERSLVSESSPEPPAAPAWSSVTSWSAVPAPATASKPPESLFPPLPQPGSWGTAAGEPASSSAHPADLPPVPEPPTEPKRPSFLDWFKSPEPEAAPEPPAAPEPAASHDWLRSPGPSVLLEPPASLDWLSSSGSPSPPDSSAPADAAAPQELLGPPEEPAPPEPPAADEPDRTADSYSWSAYAASPALPTLAPPRPPASLLGPAADTTSSAPPTAPMPKFTPTTWSVVVTSDRPYFDRMELKRGLTGPAVTFPAFSTERRFQLSGKQMRIGRRSAVRGVEPEIDLSGPPVDPGISRLHLLLLSAPDGSWAVLDPGSANGTLLNGREIAPGDMIPLRDGDRINLGAWTAITLRRE